MTKSKMSKNPIFHRKTKATTHGDFLDSVALFKMGQMDLNQLEKAFQQHHEKPLGSELAKRVVKQIDPTWYVPIPKMNEVVRREDREQEIAQVDAEFREVMENSMYPRQDIDYDDIRPIPIPPFTFPPGTSFREQIILKISYLDQKVHIEKENERRKILREVVLKELDPFDRLMEQIISDRLQGKFPEKPIDPTMNKHFARPDSYIRTYMAGKYRFT